ncbi:MAG: hypothetical protein K1X50_01810 [Candidatus Promineofilum sp.]|nr:hypothetical protein [Promineifilum sp.]
MAIDSENKRRSVMGYAGVWTFVGPRPDGALGNEADRRHVAGLYAGQLVALAVIASLAPAGAAMLFLVADGQGRILTQLRPDMERISWRFNEVGQVAWSLARTDEKLREEYVRFGNRVLIQFDNGLPAWGGVIGGGYEWGEASVGFLAFSGEALLGWRRTGRRRRFDGVSVGNIALALLAEAEGVWPVGVRPGRVWLGGPGHYPEYHYKSLEDVLRDSLVENLSAEAFDVSAREEAGRVVFELNLYEAKGATRGDVALVEGRNVSDVRFRVEDNIVNAWFMAGEGSDWGDTSRVYAEAVDEESVRLYGRREGFEVRSGVIYQSTLDATIQRRLRETAYPNRVLALATTDDRPGRFGDYGVGDTLMCVLPSFDWGGVRGMYRVLGREFFPEHGVCDLVLEEAR